MNILESMYGMLTPRVIMECFIALQILNYVLSRTLKNKTLSFQMIIITFFLLFSLLLIEQNNMMKAETECSKSSRIDTNL
jgi:hypothetical protein